MTTPMTPERLEEHRAVASPGGLVHSERLDECVTEIARLQRLEAALEDDPLIDDGFGDLGRDVVASIKRYRAAILAAAKAEPGEPK